MEHTFQAVFSQRLAGGAGPWLGVTLAGGQEHCICADVVAGGGQGGREVGLGAPAYFLEEHEQEKTNITVTASLLQEAFGGLQWLNGSDWGRSSWGPEPCLP